MAASTTTTDHAQIRQWAEARGGHPAIIRTGGRGGILRIDFGEPEEELEQVSWDEFFKVFDESNLAFLYQEESRSGESRFNKFIARDSRA